MLIPIGIGAKPALAPTHTIAEARALPDGTTDVTVQGAISVPPDVFAYYDMWMQDATAGIDVYRSAGFPAGLQLGDVVEVTGEIDTYNGKKEIVPADLSDVVLVDRGVPPTPVFTSTASINEASEGWLVVITGTVSNLGSSSFNLADGSGISTTVYRDSTTGIDLGAFGDGDLLTVVGVVSQYYDHQVMPRYQVDIAHGEVLPVALARQHSAGDIVTVQGAVTCLPGTFESVEDNREMYIQDGTAGVDVFAYGGLPVPTNTLSIGDIVTVTGEIDLYNGKLEIVPTEVVTQGLNAPVEPKIQLAGNIGESTEGLLVVVTGTISNKWTGFHSGFDLTDPSGTTAVFVDGDTGIDLSGFNNGDVVRVIGLGSQYDGSPPYDSGYQIALRQQSDVTHADVDLFPPEIASTDPISNATDANPYFPVKATFNEAMNSSTIDGTTFTLEGATGPVSGTVYYDSGRMTAVFDPDAALTAGAVYTATVAGTVEDQAGHQMGTDYTWVFTTTAVTFSSYHGSIHNHTSYSDGTGDPETAFALGRDRGLDFMAVTDHSYSIDDTEWEDTLAQAISYTVDGTYVALRGCEYTNGTEGHLNVFNTIRKPERQATGHDYGDTATTLDAFYTWIADHPEATGMFNHPGWMNFNDWQYDADAEPMLQLIEVGNGAYSYYVWTEEEYQKALDYGWYAGPSNNGDTHTNEWAIDNPGRTGIWATELTYDGVLEAMDAMRTFATEDGNFEIYLKGDDAWMGETIPNDGTIDFEIYVNDPDDESLAALELYTDQGIVLTDTVPATNPYTWTFSLNINEGIHYFFARAVQTDGDRTVTSPIWTEGDVDVAPTKLEITPAQLSTLAPANFSARVTNRGLADATGITVTFTVDTMVVGSEVITVPAGGDAFAAVNWTPSITGPVTISATITGVPTGDNPDDNTITADREIVDYPVPLVVIDNGHNNNVFASGDGSEFEDDLVAYGFNWIEDTDGITTTDLSNAVLLVISDPGEEGDDVYTPAEEQVIADYVNNGGSLLLAGDSDYHSHGNVTEVNAILDLIDGASIRLNSDGTYDDTDNGGVGPWHVLWHNFPATMTTGIGVNVDTVVGFSGCSIYGVDDLGDPYPLTTGGGVTVTVVGDDDTYQNNDDDDGVFFDYPDGALIPMAAVQELPGGGRIAVWGDSNESFSDSYTYVPGDGYQNEIYNMETVYWLVGMPLEKWDVADARMDAELNDTPDYLNRLVWVEGSVTAAYGTFFDVLYVQDDTGGVTVFAPVSGETVPTSGAFPLGSDVRVVGRVELYQGDTEIQVDWDLEQVQEIGTSPTPAPMRLSTHDAALESNEGWLIHTFGEVITKTNDYNFFMDDGSGLARVFIDGYNGDFAGVAEGDRLGIVGLASEDGNGQRIRVRGPQDVLDTFFWLPIVARDG
jgi:DNA/RNA endonuclease YhcR with UshA esterase domain